MSGGGGSRGHRPETGSVRIMAGGVMTMIIRQRPGGIMMAAPAPFFAMNCDTMETRPNETMKIKSPNV